MKHAEQQYQQFKLGDDEGTTLYVVADTIYLQSPLLLSPLLQFSPLLPITVPYYCPLCY